MISNEQLKNIRTFFTIAAQKHHLHFVSPCCLDKNNNIWVFGHLYRNNPEHGCYFDIGCNLDAIYYKNSEYCKTNNLFYSFIFSQPFEDEYNENYFSELFSDWKYNL